MQALPRAATCRVKAISVGVYTNLTRHNQNVRQSSKPLHLRCRVTASSSAQMTAELSSGTIWPNIMDRYDAATALQSSAISRTETDDELFEDPELHVQFVLRAAAALRKKPSSGNRTGGDSNHNPFLDPEEALVVGHLSPTHSLLLNKFNVVAHHVLVVTRHFEHQTQPLTAQDFQATSSVLKALPTGGVAYFNCGPESGASQPHKHIQVVPLPFMAGLPSKLPFHETLLSAAGSRSGEVHPVRSLPFCSLVTRIASGTSPENLATLADNSLAEMRRLCPSKYPLSYNLLLSDDILHVIPRRIEMSGPVSVNALGPAGSFFVKTPEQLQYIKDRTPAGILTDVCFPWPADTSCS